MKRIFIIGGGHAGSSAAIAAARAKKDLKVEKEAVSIHLIDKNPYQTIKPRLYEYALEEAVVPFSKFLPAIGVHFHCDWIQNIDVQHKIIHGRERNYTYDALILAPGSEVHPKSEAFTIDSYTEAKKLQRHLFHLLDHKREKLRIAVLGAGFTGIELATELPLTLKSYGKETGQPLPPYKISLFTHGQVGASLGEHPKATIIEALEEAGIRRKSFVNITGLAPYQVEYEDKNGNQHTEAFDLVVNCLGQKPNALMATLPFEKDHKGRLKVDQHLNLKGEANLFAAGDGASVLVDEKNLALMTCQQGRPQGRHAGYNAVAFLTRHPLADYRQPAYLTCLDLGAYGAVYTEGWDRKVVFKGREAKKYKKHINRERIYPPTTADEKELYHAGKLVFKAPRITIAHSKFRTDEA